MVRHPELAQEAVTAWAWWCREGPEWLGLEKLPAVTAPPVTARTTMIQDRLCPKYSICPSFLLVSLSDLLVLPTET